MCGVPLTMHLPDLAEARARRRGEVVRLPVLHPTRLALAVSAGGRETRELLIGAGVLVLPTRGASCSGHRWAPSCRGAALWPMTG